MENLDLLVNEAYSGKEALMLDLKHRYDVIFMDHLMPEMDGIECLGNLRNHTGGLNLTTPVIALTANAGSENRELYSRSGVEGYLIKPVSGEFLENAIMKYLPADKLILNNNKIMSMKEDINASAGIFAAQLKRAHHLIHIAITSSMSEEYRIASNAAASFDNVA